MRYIAAFLGAGLVMGVLDAVWLNLAMDRLYRPVLGEILAADLNVAAAATFYLAYLSGVVVLAVAPALKAGSLRQAVAKGAVFGLVAYATYDLTNQATLKVWATHITLIDMAWGAFLTTCAASAGYLAGRSAERPAR